MDVGRVRENDSGSEFRVDKGSREAGQSSERRIKTKEDKAFGEDMLNRSLIDLRQIDKKRVGIMFKNILGLPREGEGGGSCPRFT